MKLYYFTVFLLASNLYCVAWNFKNMTINFKKKYDIEILVIEHFKLLLLNI